MSISIEKFDYLDSAALFAKVAQEEWSVFLDSGVINERPPVTKHADFDVLAMKPTATVVCNKDKTVVSRPQGTETKKGDPLVILQQALVELGFAQANTDLPTEDPLAAYLPGALGYFSYDLARRYERLPEISLDDERLPDMAMGLFGCIVLVDHRAKQTLLISIDQLADTDAVVNEWRQRILALQQPMPLESEPKSSHVNKLKCGEMHENMTRQEYQASFDRVRQYTVDGDCYQVNLAKRFSTRVMGDCWQTYDYLRQLSPAPYGAYLNLPFAQVLSNSPESFIQCRDSHVVTSPIKGTRARDHADQDRDRQIAKELSNSAKDRAENLMIVDLMRNDLSTCCELGSVKVPKLFALHSFANVHHLISTVSGRLRCGLHSLDLLRQCFPGGSITGAPKIRAMQIIEELESRRRGLYCGAVGYVGMDGNMETNIAIRTIVVKDGVARYWAGGGLVIDSDVDEEYQEVVDKAKMMTEALFD